MRRKSNGKSNEYFTFFVASNFFRYFLPLINELLVTLLKFVTVTSDSLLLTRYLTSLSNLDLAGEL